MENLIVIPKEQISMSDIIVCYTTDALIDHYEAFRGEARRAAIRYREILKRPDTYSASICRVIRSTDYKGGEA